MGGKCSCLRFGRWITIDGRSPRLSGSKAAASNTDTTDTTEKDDEAMKSVGDEECRCVGGVHIQKCSYIHRAERDDGHESSILQRNIEMAVHHGSPSRCRSRPVCRPTACTLTARPSAL